MKYVVMVLVPLIGIASLQMDDSKPFLSAGGQIL